MSYELNKKIKELVPYEPISGTYEIRLDANESPYNYTDKIKNDVRQVVSKIDFNRYPDPLATELINSFAEYYNINPNMLLQATV